MSASEFLGVRVRPGETVRARVPVAELADGTSVTLPWAETIAVQR